MAYCKHSRARPYQACRYAYCSRYHASVCNWTKENGFDATGVL